jgi:hypothetical protein
MPLLASLFACFLWTAVPARADGDVNPAILNVNNSVDVAYKALGLYYDEPSDTDQFTVGANYDDYEQGSLPGVRVAGSLMFPEDAHWYLHGEYSINSADAAYTGFSQGTPAIPISDITAETIQEYGVKLGRGFPEGERWLLTPYLTLGGRHWRRDLGPGEPTEFVETYNHYYGGLGSLVQVALSDRWVATGDAMIGRTFAPTIDDPPDGLNKASLGTTPMLKLGVEADYGINANLHFYGAFDYTWFGYGQSDIFPDPNNPGYGVMEPISWTEETTFLFGLRWAFAVR